ncbi:MAG TPA: PIG-L family deacetylase, partial [Kofleriaceae bacterium]
MRLALVLAVVAACGDNDLPEAAGLVPAQDLAIVAHQDDDLLFMQPDLLDAVRAGTGVAIVYVTAGNDDRDLDYAQRRYAGVRAAYTAATGESDWECGWFELAGYTAEHCRLAAANLSLVFLGYPDGGRHGEFAASLLALWQGRITGADTVAARSAHYDREGLIATVAAAITATRPRTIRTLEVAATHGDDHSDHMMVGALAVLAHARAGVAAELLSYRGYDIAGEPANDLAPATAIAADAFAHYSACAEGCAPCGDACPMFSATYAAYLHRHYAVRIDRVVAQFTASSPLALDEEGHIWTADPPATATALDHLECLAPVDDVPTPTLCGGDGAAVWEVLPPTVTTSRAALGLAQTGRAVRLADMTGDGIADLCADDGSDLWCAAGDGAGSFAPATRIAALAIDPATLAIGVLAGQLDACGEDGTGTACASGRRFPAIAAPAIAGGELCGRSAEGASCATRVLSPWPDPAAPVWFADLDADGATDWCAATPDGPACGRSRDRALSTDGVAWSYALAGVRDAAPASADTAALADIDGDGRADFCAIDGLRVTCAFSHGSAFGPRVPILELATPPLALWGDDSGALCADLVTSVTCLGPARQPLLASAHAEGNRARAGGRVRQDRQADPTGIRAGAHGSPRDDRVRRHHRGADGCEPRARASDRARRWRQDHRARADRSDGRAG